jgi:hypothetical protein
MKSRALYAQSSSALRVTAGGKRREELTVIVGGAIAVALAPDGGTDSRQLHSRQSLRKFNFHIFATI